ncbi:Heat shock cognate 70 kDa protein 2 [Spatholobus suberectus]|nr:Heat shock cognate 70 kDa protein 2 [Spatholobus suberectus]
MAKRYEGCAVGIDLGTTYSCVAVWQEQHCRVEIIHNDQGNNTTPSFVAFTDHQRLIGDAAKNQAAANPENTVFDAKRLIGRKYSDPIIQKDKIFWPFKVVAGNNDKPMIGIDFYSSITRAKFEEINMELFEECMETVDRCLTYAKMEKSHDSQSAGAIAGLLRGKDLCKSINPDEAVAYGAAVQAALLSEGIKNVPNLVLSDVTPLSLGASTHVGVMSVVIPRNTSIPVRKTEVYSTIKDNQHAVQINVYEGERTRAKDNNLLGSFVLSGFPPAPRGHPLYVCFAIDANGILTVSAEEKTNGTKSEITIINGKERLSAEEIGRLIQEAEKYREEDKRFLRKAKAMNSLDRYVYKMRNGLKRKDISSKLCSPARKKINSAITKATNLLDSNNQQDEAEVFEDYLKDLASHFEPIVGKID